MDLISFLDNATEGTLQAEISFVQSVLVNPHLVRIYYNTVIIIRYN